MKISLKYLTSIIKEELEDVYVDEEQSTEDLVARAREEVGLIDLQRAIERGDFDNQTAAAALRMLADEFEAEVDASREDNYDRANRKNREDTEWHMLPTPKEDPMGRGRKTSSLRKKVMGPKLAETGKRIN